MKLTCAVILTFKVEVELLMIGKRRLTRLDNSKRINFVFYMLRNQKNKN